MTASAQGPRVVPVTEIVGAIVAAVAVLVVMSVPSAVVIGYGG
jgi:hypothetical protein